MSNLRIYLVGFACIEAVVGTFLLINTALCLRKCRRKCCPKKKKGENKRLAQSKTEEGGIELEEVSDKGGARYKNYL